ncbi:MAG: hypothetical protein WCJ30_24760, partial [Deltaproteobacteria bacterium]
MFYLPRPRDARFVMWQVDRGPTRATSSAKVGKVAFVFDPPPEVLRPEDICYPAVPAFHQVESIPHERRIAVPTLPVRHDRLDFLDSAATVKPGTVVRGRYQAELPLKGLATPYKIELPLVGANGNRPIVDPERDGLRGLNIRWWPNVPFVEWKRFFLSIGAAEDAGKKLFEIAKPFCAFWVGSNLVARPLSRTTSGGDAVVACTDERPSWVALCLGEPGKPVAGGVWRIPAPTRTYQGTEPLDVAVDFGTANTALAYKIGNGAPESLPIDPPEGEPSATGYLVRSGKERTVHSTVETWVPKAGFGARKDLLPSEILLNGRVDDEIADSQRISAWKPIEDYCVPSGGLEVQYPERDYIIQNLKWSTQVVPPKFQNSETAQALQVAYLEFVTLYLLGQLYARLGEAPPKTLTFHYAIPLVFSRDQRQSFATVWETVGARIAASTGLWVEPHPGQFDESTVVAANDLGQFKTHARLFVDVGGGTSDIALQWDPRAVKDGPKECYVTSVQYAGGVFLSAIAPPREVRTT